MPESEPQKPLRLEVISENGEEALFTLDYDRQSVADENGHEAELHPYEFDLLELLASAPNCPFKLADIRTELPAFTGKYAPPPLDVVQGLLEEAPFLAGHLLGIVKQRTQFFSFLDTARDVGQFKVNVERVIEGDSRRDRVAKAIGASLTAAGLSTALVGYMYKRSHKERHDN